VIPIAGCAVKLHFEHPPTGHPKLLWAPFGTVPDPGQTKPRHGLATLWPWPQPPYEREERAAIAEYDAADWFPSRAEAEAFADRDTPDDGKWLHLCPGELKALAVLSAGLPATAITGGEAHRWTPALLAPFRGRRVCLVYDEDDAGRRFRDATVCALRGVAASVRAITFGRNPQ
jgi:acetyl esterase/lipase